MKQQDWNDWLSSPVTKAVMQHLSERKDDLLEGLLNIQDHSLEAIAIKHVAARSALQGLGEVLDLETLAESCGVIPNED